MIDPRVKKYTGLMFLLLLLFLASSLISSIWLLFNIKTDREFTLLLMNIPLLFGLGYFWAQYFSYKEIFSEAKAKGQENLSTEVDNSEIEFEENRKTTFSNKSEILGLIFVSLPVLALTFCIVVGLLSGDDHFVSQAALVMIPFLALFVWRICSFFYGKTIMRLSIEADQLEEKLKSSEKAAM